MSKHQPDFNTTLGEEISVPVKQGTAWPADQQETAFAVGLRLADAAVEFLGPEDNVEQGMAARFEDPKRSTYLNLGNSALITAGSILRRIPADELVRLDQEFSRRRPFLQNAPEYTPYRGIYVDWANNALRRLRDRPVSGEVMAKLLFAEEYCENNRKTLNNRGTMMLHYLLNEGPAKLLSDDDLRLMYYKITKDDKKASRFVAASKELGDSYPDESLFPSDEELRQIAIQLRINTTPRIKTTRQSKSSAQENKMWTEHEKAWQKFYGAKRRAAESYLNSLQQAEQKDFVRANKQSASEIKSWNEMEERRFVRESEELRRILEGEPQELEEGEAVSLRSEAVEPPAQAAKKTRPAKKVRADKKVEKTTSDERHFREVGDAINLKVDIPEILKSPEEVDTRRIQLDPRAFEEFGNQVALIIKSLEAVGLSPMLEDFKIRLPFKRSAARSKGDASPLNKAKTKGIVREESLKAGKIDIYELVGILAMLKSKMAETTLLDSNPASRQIARNIIIEEVNTYLMSASEKPTSA